MATELLSEGGHFFWLLLLGGWVAVDGTSVGQLMVSRPFVAATLAGWIVGFPAAGAMVGLILEVFHMAVLPVGAARYPEGGPPAVAAGAVFAASSHLSSTLLTVVVFALAWEWISGSTVHYMRQTNVHLLLFHPSTRVDTLERRHLSALALDFARGIALVAIGILGMLALVVFSQPRWTLGERAPEILLGALVVGLLATSHRMFAGRIKLFVAGAVGGVLFLLLR